MMRALIVVVVVVLLCGCDTLQSPAERAYLLGLRAEKGENDADPLLSYDRAIQLDPNEARYWAARASLRERRDEPTLAIADYTKALALLPPRELYRASLLGERAVCRSALGDPTAALADVDAALAIRPDDPQLHAYRALALLVAGGGRSAEALASIDRAIALTPRHQKLRYLRGVVLARAGRRAEAVAQFASTVGVVCVGAGETHRSLYYDGEHQARRALSEPLVALFRRGDYDSGDPKLRCY